MIGLAIAHKLSHSSPRKKILLIESNNQFGSETSSRNSEVIHAGIYYPPQSLKANLCRQGSEKLYDFCKTYKIPHKPLGKLIIASRSEDLAPLSTLYKNAANNGVELRFLSQKECNVLEPNVNAQGALYSPSTGIIDAHSFMNTLLTLAEQNGVLYSPNTHFIKAQQTASGFEILLNTVDGEFSLCSTHLINSAGLWAPLVANKILTLEKSPIDRIPHYHLCRGHYFSYQGKSPFSHLIYPIPDQNHSGLGIHATLDLSGQVRFGPDTDYIEKVDYSFSHTNADVLKEKFSQSIKRYFPALDPQKLQPSYTGIRPKLSAANTPARDFMIQGQEAHGVTGLVNLLGMESPGLTASLAIADHVSELFKNR